MNRELAQMVAMTASRTRVSFGELISLLKAHGEGEKDDKVRLAIASAIYEIGEIEERVFNQHPDLKEAFEARLQKYGRSFY